MKPIQITTSQSIDLKFPEKGSQSNSISLQSLDKILDLSVGRLTKQVTLSRKIETIEDMMLQCTQLSLQVRHYFIPGVYAREIFIPEGTLLTGRVHKQEQINVMSQGDIAVLVNDEMIRVKAPYTVVSPAGVKRIAYAFKDTIWTTFLRTDLTDPEQIELELTEGERCLSLQQQ